MTTLASYGGDLLQLVWVALAASVAVGGCFGVCVYGATRASDRRRDGNTGAASAFGVLGVVAGVVFAAAIVAGVAVITTK